LGTSEVTFIPQDLKKRGATGGGNITLHGIVEYDFSSLVE
jgi:hypothetical protein